MSGCPLEIVLWPKTTDRYNYYYRPLTMIMIESPFVWLTARVCSLQNNFLFFGLCFCLFSANLMFSWLAFSFQSLIVLWELNVRTIIKNITYVQNFFTSFLQTEYYVILKPDLMFVLMITKEHYIINC
jgi:hypothetical protein